MRSSTFASSAATLSSVTAGTGAGAGAGASFTTGAGAAGATSFFVDAISNDLELDVFRY
jgi:hypothetical protein